MSTSSPPTVAEYQVPPILNSLRKFVDFSRSQYSTDFSQFIVATATSSSGSDSDDSASSSSSSSTNGNGDDSDSYRSGLILLGALVWSVLVLWLLVLLILKAKGKSMGCSSGRSFRAVPVRGAKNTATATNNTASTTQTTTKGQRAAARTVEDEIDDSSSSSSSSSCSPSSSDAGRIGTTRTAASAGSLHPYDEASEFSSSIRSSEMENGNNDDQDGAKKQKPHNHRQSSRTQPTTPRSDSHTRHQADADDYTQKSDDSLLYKPTRRERRTQIAFFVLGIMTLACVPLILTLCFAPLKTSTTESQDMVLSVRELVNQVDSALSTIGTAASMSKTILTTTPTNFTIVCPNVNESVAEEYLGLEDDLDDMIALLEENYHALIDGVSANVSQVSRIVQRIDKSVVLVEGAYQQADTYIWVVPALLLALSALTAMAMFGVILSWKRQSNRRLQRILSYGVLPALLTASLVCWILAVAAVISTAMTSDACTDGSSTGTPDATIHSILLDLGVDANSTIYDFANAYTGGCALGEEPTQILVDMEDQVQYLVDTIWRYLSSVDSVGRTDLRELCGGNSIDDFLNGARDLAKILTSVRRAIVSLQSALSCSSVYPIYTQVVHDSVCTDTASALAWGFLLFLVIGITTMGMISLRASWRHKIEQDPIYDEDDVAENMFVDEHEEYLAYISKYKHEWEEYEGVNGAVVPAPVVVAAENTASAGATLQQDEGEISSASTSESEMSTTSSSSVSMIDDGESPQRPQLLDEECNVSFTDEDGQESEISYEHRLFDPYLISTDTDTDQEHSRGMSTDEISFLSLLEMQTITPTSQQQASAPDDSSRDNIIVPIPASLLQQQRAPGNFQRPGCEDVDGIPPPMAPPSKSRVSSSPKFKPTLTVMIDDPVTKPAEETSGQNDFSAVDEEKKDDDVDHVSQSSSSPLGLERGPALMLEPSLLSKSAEPSPVNRHRLDLLLQSTSSGSGADDRTNGSSSFLPSSSSESALPSSSFLPSTDESCRSTSPSSFLEPSTFLQLSVYPSSVEATLNDKAGIVSSKHANVVSLTNLQEENTTSSASPTVSGVPSSSFTNVSRNEFDVNRPPGRILMSRSPTKTKKNSSGPLSPLTRPFDSPNSKCPQSPASFGSLRSDKKVRAKRLAPTQSLRAEHIMKELDCFYDGLQFGGSKKSPRAGGSGDSCSPPKLVRSISVPRFSASGGAAAAAVHFLMDDDEEPFSNVRKQVDRFSGPLNKNIPRNKTPTASRQKHHLTAMFDSPQAPR